MRSFVVNVFRKESESGLTLHHLDQRVAASVVRWRSLQDFARRCGPDGCPFP
jgi:hypothetical protein